MEHRLIRFALAQLDAVAPLARVNGPRQRPWKFEVFHLRDEEWGAYHVTYCLSVDDVRAIPDVACIYAIVSAAAELPPTLAA